MEAEESWCKVCELEFKFPSRLKRHCLTQKHLRMEAFKNELSERDELPPQLCGSNNLLEDIVVDCGTTMLPAESDPSSTEEEMECMTESPGESSDSESIGDEIESGSDITEMESQDIASMFSQEENGDFYPFPSKTAALGFVLLKSLRPVSERIVSFALHMCKQLDPTSPSLHQVKSLELPGLTPPTKCYSSKRIPYYVNLPSTILSKCLGNPITASLLKRYPVLSENITGEIFEAERWHTNPVYCSPMAIIGGRHLFVGDIVCLNNQSSYGKILKFMTENIGYNILQLLHDLMVLLDAQPSVKKPQTRAITGKSTGQMLIKVQEVYWCPTTQKYILGDEVVVFSEQIGDAVVSIPFNKDDVLTGQKKTLTDKEWAFLKGHHYTKDLAQHRPVVSVPIILYTDDLSGNKSKKWNKFDIWALLLAGIPKDKNTDLHNIHFITCSNEVDCIELIDGFVNDLVTLETEGIVTYDAHLQCEVLLIAPVIAVISDNPRASEITSHMGSTAKHYCRICMCDKDTSAHKTGTERSKESSMSQMARINALSGSRSRELQTKYGLYGQANSLFQLSIDLYKSTPIECLHTILLGGYKYFFHDLMQRLPAHEKKIISAKITCFPKSGQTTSLSGGITKYYQSCVGRDFKALAQMAPFVLWEHLTSSEKKLWLLLSEVFRAAYSQQVHEHTIADVRRSSTELVQSVKEDKPKLLQKPKFHLLLHLADCMQAFGPTMAYNTERCETFNGLMREYNLHTNRQSSSRDIALRFAVMEQLNFLLHNGVEPGNSSIRIGSGLAHLLTSPEVQMYTANISRQTLFSTKNIYQHGTLRKEQTTPLTFHMPEGIMTLNELRAGGYLFYMTDARDTQLKLYKAVYLKNGVLGEVGDNVAFRRNTSAKVEYGRITSLFQAKDSMPCAVLAPYRLVGAQNEQKCDLVELSHRLITVESKLLVQTVSVVHECCSSCHFERRATIVKERELTNTDKYYSFTHAFSHNLYSINKYSLSFVQ